MPEIQGLDRWAIEKVGIPSLALMENAGRGVAQEIYKKLKNRKKSSVVVMCGTGNNGGDGFVAARYLLNWGFKPRVFLVGTSRALKSDALINYRVAKSLKIKVKPIIGLDTSLKRSLQSADLIVDAIFGVGLNRLIQEPYSGIIQAINAQGSYVIAVDIPSGLDGTTGKIYGICVKANMTVSFSALKKGFFKNDGPFYTGRHVVVDIGIPLKSLRSSTPSQFLYRNASIGKIQPGIYEHYKAKRYQVLGMATHTETQELLVVYKALYKGNFPEGMLWVRPLAMFKESVMVDGKLVPRFPA